MNSLQVVARPSSTPSKGDLPARVKNGKAAKAPKKKVTANAKPPKDQKAPAVAKALRAQQLPPRKKSLEKLPIAMYRDLLKDLKASNRPKSLSALEHHIQTKFGPAPAKKVQLLIERLLTSDVIHLADRKLGYGPPQG